jgi:hypothetical protein
MVKLEAFPAPDNEDAAGAASSSSRARMPVSRASYDEELWKDVGFSK